MGTKQHYKVVVGVDGTRSSEAALRWSFWHVRLAQGSVVAVRSWEYPELYEWPMLSYSQVTQRITAELADTVGAVADPASPVVVDERVTEGHPARALLQTVSEESADLLVVGNRGHCGFTEAFLGSIGQYCVQHASCPVVIVRSPAASGE